MGDCALAAIAPRVICQADGGETSCHAGLCFAKKVFDVASGRAFVVHITLLDLHHSSKSMGITPPRAIIGFRGSSLGAACWPVTMISGIRMTITG